MRFLFFLLFTITVSAQNNTKNIFANRAPCEFEMSKEELMTKNISFHCTTLFGNTSFEIENFKLKIKNNSSIHIKGNRLNNNAKALIKSLQPGDSVVFFDIKELALQNSDDPVDKVIETLVVKIR